MDNAHVWFLLRSCRPGRAENADSLLAPALEAAARDTELGAWLEAEQRADRAVARHLRQMPVPANLADSILANLAAPEPIVEEPVAPRRSWAPLALAAAIVLFAALGVFWALRPGNATDFVHYRQDMIGRLAGPVRFSLQSERVADLQQWLADQRGLQGTVIPAGLSSRPSLGCRSWDWNGRPAGLICFLLEGGQAVHLFVVPQGAVPKAPAAADSPRFEKVGDWETASWTRDGLVYVLAGRTGRDGLARLL